MRKVLWLAASFALAATLTLVAVAGPAAADTAVTGFEDFALGSPDAQFGWSATGSAGGGCAVYDHAIVNNTYGITSFGAKSLRMSNAVTSGCFGDGTFSTPLADEAGETDAINGGESGGSRQPYFQASWDFASADPSSHQTGLSVVASPDRGDGARMSWVQMADTPAGLEVNFIEYIDAATFGGTGTETDGYGPEDDFVSTTVATGLDRTVVHDIVLTVELLDGQHNDVVTVCVDGTTCHTGTSWEDYFRFTQGPPAGPEWNGVDDTGSRTIDSVLFRTGGAAALANAGKGFLIDNLRTTSSPVPASTTVVVDPVNMNGWGFFNEGATGSGALVVGPAGALNDGSAQLVVDATGRHNIGTVAFGGTRLDEISELSYSSYRASTDPGNLFAVSLQFEFDDDLTDLNDTFRGRLVFEPYLTVGSGNIAEDTWYTWDTLDGKWWSSNAGFAATCSQASPCTIEKVLDTWPNAGIRNAGITPSSGLLNFRAGGPWGPGFDGNVDDFRTAISGTETIFDFEPETPCSAVCYVNGATGNDAFGGSTPETAKKTIQAAVNQVDVGGMVIVTAGTYAEHVTMNKAVTLEGANAGIAGNDGRAPESVISGSASGALQITANDVTVDGFQISSPSNNLGTGVHMSSAISGALVTNNFITGNQVGVYANSAGASTISDNLFDANNEPGAAGGSGIYSEFTNGLTIEGNEFANHTTNNPIIFAATAAGVHLDLTVSGNDIHDNVSGIFVLGVDGGGFVDNDISAAGGTALSFGGGGNTDIQVTGNVLHDSARGVRLQDFGFGLGSDSDIHVNRNAIIGNSSYGVANESGYTGTLDATCNWWGQATGPASGAVMGDVDHVPWLTTSDLDGDCFGGAWTFQGFSSPVHNDDPNPVKAGRSVPLKWRILDEDGIPIDDPSSFVSLTSFVCGDPLGVVDESDATNTGLVSLGDGYWQFNWDTNPAYTGQCRTLALTLGDGSVHTAEFQFK